MSFQSLDDLYKGIERFKASKLKIVYIKDRFSNPLPSGYRDINALFYDEENDIVGEIQFHLCHILKAKSSEGHRIYEEIRNLEAEALKNQKGLTEEVKILIGRLNEASVTLYHDQMSLSETGHPCGTCAKEFKELSEMAINLQE